MSETITKLLTHVDDANKAHAAYLEAMGRGAVEVARMHLMLLEESARQIAMEVNVELNAMYESDEGPF